jgi:hypothetical protein
MFHMIKTVSVEATLAPVAVAQLFSLGEDPHVSAAFEIGLHPMHLVFGRTCLGFTGRPQRDAELETTGAAMAFRVFLNVASAVQCERLEPSSGSGGRNSRAKAATCAAVFVASHRVARLRRSGKTVSSCSHSRRDSGVRKEARRICRDRPDHL